jgi:hypothetical protein
MSARTFCACNWALFGTTMCRSGKYEILHFPLVVFFFVEPFFRMVLKFLRKTSRDLMFTEKHLNGKTKNLK